MPRVPQLIAHRGNAAEHPENSLPALRSALALGVHRLEFDVQLTVDHVPVVVHDDNLRRVCGIDRSVLATPWAALGEVELLPAADSAANAPVLIPALRDVAALLAATPVAQAFVELKRASLRAFGAAAVLERVAAVLAPVMQQCTVISFDQDVLVAARRDLGLRIGWVLSDTDAASRQACTKLAPDYLFCNHERLPSGPLWSGPWQWAIYEVTNAEQALALGARGAAFVESMQVRALAAGLAAAQKD